MSAYIVSDETMQRVVRLICTSWAYGRTPVARMGDVYLREGSVADCCDQVGRRLFTLNAEAVQQRYPQDMDCVAPHFVFNGNYRPCEGDDLVRCFKSLQCLIYQCSEGDVVNSDLYKQLEKFANYVAVWIVSHTHEYEAAPWE